MPTSTRTGACLLCVLLLASISSPGYGADETGKAAARSSYQLRAFVLGAGGAPAAGLSYKSNATAGQSTPVGLASAGGNTLYSGFWGQAGRTTPTGVSTPVAFKNELYQNYPNPFNPTTTIRYSVGAFARVVIRIYNVKGQTVRTLVDENKPAGIYRLEWNGRNNAGLTVASGVYFCRLGIGTFGSVKKLVLLK